MERREDFKGKHQREVKLRDVEKVVKRRDEGERKIER